MTIAESTRVAHREILTADSAAPALPPRPGVGRRLARGGLPVLAALALLVTAWQVLVWVGARPRYVVPAPLDVAGSLGAAWSDGTLPSALAHSVGRGLLGFAVAVVIGTVLGLAVARVAFLRVPVRPILAGLITLPNVAWVPLAIVLFGLTSTTVYAVLLLGSVPAIANSLVSAVDGVPPVLLRAGRVLGARGLSSLRHVVLPAALPGYLVGLRQGWAFSWHALMAAEVIAVSPKIGPGLGQFLAQGREASDAGAVFAAILAIFAVGIAVDRLILDPVERVVLRRRGLATR